jgi:hypothetical protein
MMEYKNAYRILVGKPEGNRQLGRRRHWWFDSIKIYLREIRWDVMDWFDLVQDRDQWRALVNTARNLRVAYNFRKFLNSCTTGGFSTMAQLHEVNYL